ncbi:3277_t:CDS:2, partial [Racocetra fulgida]
TQEICNEINRIRETSKTENERETFQTENERNERAILDLSDEVNEIHEADIFQIDQKQASEDRSLNSIFDEIASKIDICKGTVRNFYKRKTKNPQQKTKDEIRKWVNEEGGNHSNLNN